MRMKRIFALVVCVVLVCLTLVGCKKDIDWLAEYGYEPEEVVEVYYDFYIVTGAETDKKAVETVMAKLNQLFSDKYNTKLNMHYISEESYENGGLQAKINERMAANYQVPQEYSKCYYGGKIVLITDYSMLEDVTVGEKKLGEVLAPLDSYLETNAFGKLNTQIASTLLAAAENTDRGTLAIPNNRRIGEYTYCVVNRTIAENVYGLSAQTQIPMITSFESEYAQELINKGATRGVDGAYYYGSEKLMYITTGNYEDKIENQSDEWFWNVSEYPVATTEMAYESAFGVIPSANIYEDKQVTNQDGSVTTQEVLVLDYAARAMEIIYAINTDVAVRNTLQYGVQNTHFYLGEDNVVDLAESETNNYVMDLKYTGDILKAYYFGEEWTSDMAASLKKQNDESVFSE